MSLYHYIFHKNISNSVALQDGDIRLTYKELVARIKHFAVFLLHKGFGRGKILVLLPNCAEFVISFFSVNMLGGSVTLADIKFRDELNLIISENKYEAIITNMDTLEKTKHILMQYKDIHIIVTEQIKSVYFEEDPINNVTPDTDDNKEALILYTSGTTGKIKGCRFLQRNLISGLNNYISSVPIRSDDTFIGVTPFFHSYSFGSCLLPALYLKAKIICLKEFRPKQVLKTICQEQGTVFHGVPYMYEIFNCLEFDKNEIKSLRLCVSAGSKINEDIIRAFYNKTGLLIHQEYGSTETATIAFNLSEKIDEQINYTGNLLNGVKIYLDEIKSDENTGILFIENKAASIGYTDLSMVMDHIHCTNDIVKCEKSFIKIVGRNSRIINIAGLKVHPEEIEEVIMRIPWIEAVKVQSVSSDDFGENIEVLVKADKNNFDEKEIYAICRQNLAAYKIPVSVIRVDDLEKTSLGKIKTGGSYEL